MFSKLIHDFYYAAQAGTLTAFHRLQVEGKAVQLWGTKKSSYSKPHKDKYLQANLVSNHKEKLSHCYYTLSLLQGSLKSMKSSFFCFWCILYLISFNTFCINHIYLTFKLSDVRVYHYRGCFSFQSHSFHHQNCCLCSHTATQSLFSLTFSSGEEIKFNFLFAVVLKH